MNLAWRYRAIGKWEEEKAALTALHNRFTESELGWFALGLMYEDEGLRGNISGLVKATEAHLKAASYHGYQGIVALLGAANCYLFLQRYKEALECAERLLKEYPDAYEEAAREAEWIVARCYMGLNYDKEKIIAQFRKIIDEFPNTRTAAASYMEIMAIHIASGDIALANRELEEIIKRFKDTYPNVVSMALARMGSYYFSSGDYEKAIKYYQRAIEEVPQFGDVALIRVGVCYRMQYKLKEAIEAFQQVLDRYPNSKECSRALLLKGQCLYQMGRKEEAIKAFEDILRNYPNSQEAREAKDLVELCRESAGKEAS